MPTKLIENVFIKESQNKGVKQHKKLKESYDYNDFGIMYVDYVLEGMNGNATDEEINNSIKVFNFIKSQFKLPRIDDLCYTQVSDELEWELTELSEVVNMKSYKGSEVQILKMETDDFGTILFAKESLNNYRNVFYFKSEQDVENVVKWINQQQVD